MANTSVAYDFDRFGPSNTAHKAPVVAQPPELRMVKSRQHVDNSFWVYMAVVFICVLAVLAALLYNKMMLTELTSQMEGMQGQYLQLQNEYNRMNIDLESKVSLRTAEEIATTKLGMAKVENYQIMYVDLGSQSRVLRAVEVTPAPTDYVKAICYQIGEYFTK